MSWIQRAADWIAPKAEKVAAEAGAAVDQAKDRIVVVAQQKTGMSRRVALFLLVLALLSLGVGGYAIYWRYFRPVKPPAALVPVQTQGGETVYQGNQVPAMARAAKTGKPKPRVTVRPVATIPVEDLPPEEQAKVPAIAPAAGLDNVVRKIELADTQVVPPARGETYARAYLLPDGTVKIFQDPQREKFWGFTPKRGAVGIGYGIGAAQMATRGRWEPLRMGNVFVTAEGTGWMRPDGRMEGSVMGWVEYRFGR